MRRATITIALALGMCLGAAGCGGRASNTGIASAAGARTKASATPSPTPSGNMQDQLLRYAACMRAHGVNMPDPQVNGGRFAMQIPKGASQAKIDAAQSACKQYLPNGGAPPSMSPADVERQRKYAACMRQHGVDMADPDPNGGLRINGVKPDDPKFKAAADACQSLNPMGKK
jgi:hypothetical protein